MTRGVLTLLCSLSHLLCAPADAQTSAIPVTVVLMLPNTWAGETFSGMTFHPTNRGRTLLLWPCTNCGGSGTSIVTQVTVNGLTNLNGLTNGSQTFVVGNGGTDFAIVSAAGVHTFNLPTASASVRGALSSADWSTFAGKQAPITVQTQGVVLATAPTTWNFNSGATGYVSGATMVLGMSASGGAPAGANNQLQFYQDGAFAATSRLDYVRAVHSLIVSGLDGLGSNETRAKIVMTNDTGTRLEVNASGLSSQGVIQFNIGPNAALFGSNVMNLIAGLGLNPGVSNDLTLGGANNPWSTANAVNARLKDRLTMGIGPGLVSAQRTNASPDTNVIWHSFFAPSAGQVRKFHSVTYDAAGTAHIVETNATDNTGGSLSGSTNFLSLSVQAAKLPTTNYPGIDAGWQGWETIYAETNSEGSRANLNASWQLVVPPDYATNSLQLLINYSLLATNGPNASNVIFGVSCLPVRSGTTNNVHTNAFGFTAWGTNDWIPKYDGTNIVTNLVISLGTNAAILAQDLAVLKVTRDAVNDTFGNAIAVHGLQLYYTRP